MSSAKGLNSILGIGKQVDYDTALAAPTDKVPFFSESISEDLELLPDETLEGVAGVRELYENFRTSGGALEVPLMYTVENTSFKSADLLIAAAMGACTWHAGSATNILTLSKELEVFLTMGILKGSTVWEAIGAMMNSMTFNFSANDFAKLNYDILAKKVITTGQSFSQAELEALLSDLSKLVPFRQTCMRIGDQVDALGDADKLGVNTATVTINNNLSTQEQQSCWENGDTLYPIQPERNGKRIVEGTFVVPRYTAETLKDWSDNQTSLQMDIVCTLSASYTITLKMPYVRIKVPEINVGGAELLTQNISFQALMNNGNTFMQTVASANIVNELVVELKNERTASIL